MTFTMAQDNGDSNEMHKEDGVLAIKCMKRVEILIMKCIRRMGVCTFVRNFCDQCIYPTPLPHTEAPLRQIHNTVLSVS